MDDTNGARMNVGMIGLGAMGGPMTRALLGAGHAVSVFDVSAAALERATDGGATAADSAAGVASVSEVVLLSLPTPALVERVMTGSDGVLAGANPHLVVADTSTVDPDSTRRMAELARPEGVAYLDAPVLGRPDACGRWTMPVGGDPDALERAHPALAALASTVTHVGGPGTGNAIKLLNNLMFGAINAISVEVMAACERVGVDPRTFYETVATSGAATVSPLFQHVGRTIIEGDYTPVFTVDLLHKDVSLALEMIANAGGSSPVGEATLDQIERARAAGLGPEDTAAVAKLFANLQS
jgi:3-hydroxyisobutyrate dehydrogenase-like beta-hydroxyacid dehydrogenase